MTKTYISIEKLNEILGSEIMATIAAPVCKFQKTLDEHQVAEIEAMNGYMGHSLIEDCNYDDDDYLGWFVNNELEDECTFKSESAFLDARRELEDTIRIEAVGAYFVAINKNA